jgi:hypothetical protein
MHCVIGSGPAGVACARALPAIRTCEAKAVLNAAFRSTVFDASFVLIYLSVTG